MTLKEAFQRTIRDWLTEEQIAEVDRLNHNELQGTGACATHDFCDANEAMVEAFQLAFQRAPGIHDDADLVLWNKAWTAAKEEGFQA